MQRSPKRRSKGEGLPTAKSKKSDAAPIEIPGDGEQAARWVFARAKKLANERTYLGKDIQELLKEAKRDGANVAGLRLASRLSRMSPEARDKWEQTINDAAIHFGYSKLEVIDMPGRASNRPHGEILERIVNLEADKKLKAEELRETYSAAKEAGVDVDSVRLFVRMAAAKDAEEIKDWFDSIDMAGKTLGVWDGNFEDLSDDEF